VSIDCDAFGVKPHQGAMVTVPVGDELVVQLCSNASTGYGWSDPVIADPTILSPTGATSEPPASPMPGAPGTQTFTFQGMATGSTTVDLSYDQPWEGGEKGTWTLHLDVGVAVVTLVTIECDAFAATPDQSTSVELQVGGDLVVTVCSNASTGFSWVVPTVGDPAVIGIVGATTQGPESTMPGAPGTQTFTFHAVGPGSTTTVLSYDRPWEGGEKGSWTLTIDVVVA
jgi:inhibitor of cysteine peptidase